MAFRSLSNWKIEAFVFTRVFQKTFWVLSDQGLLSITNFITMTLIGRGLTPAAFGVFALIYSGLLFGSGLQFALITQPHNILGAARTGSDYVRYTTSTACIQLVFASCIALVILIGAIVAHSISWPNASVVMALSPACFAFQVQEFVRRVLYTERRFVAAFVNDLIAYGGQAIWLAVVSRQQGLDGAQVLYILAATSGIAVMIGVWQLRNSLGRQIDWMVVRDNWSFGKWLGGAEVAYWLSGQLYIFLASAMLGTTAAAILKIAQILFGPLRILMFSVTSVLPSRFARTLVTTGRTALHNQFKMAYLAVGPALAIYCLGIAVFARPLLHLLYGDKYIAQAGVMALYALYAFVTQMTQILSSALRARHATRAIFMNNLYTSFLSIGLGWALIWAFQLPGAIIGMLLASLYSFGFFWRTYQHNMHQDV